MRRAAAFEQGPRAAAVFLVAGAGGGGGGGTPGRLGFRGSLFLGGGGQGPSTLDPDPRSGSTLRGGLIDIVDISPI